MSGAPWSSSDHLYAIGRQIQRRSRSGFALAFVKIGRSKEPDDRLVSLCSQFRGQDLWLIESLPGMADHEKSVHHALAPWHVEGEWFDHVVLVAIMRWGLAEFVQWALKREGAPWRLAQFMGYANMDIEDPSVLEQLGSKR